MKYQLQILTICLLVLALSAKKWSESIKLEPNLNSSIGLNLFMANVNKSYVLYSRPEPNNKTQELGVKVYDALNKSLSNFTKLSTDRLYFTADIQGSGDGEQILVASAASRSKVVEFPEDGTSFYTIFLTHTETNNSWSNEVSIDQGTNQTHVARIDPLLIGVEELGHMYIFYMSIHPDNNTSLAVVKYVPDKEDLVTEEHIIVSENNPLFAFSAAYSYVNETLTLHVVFAGNNSKLMYTSSEDGKNWTEPITLVDISLGSHVVALAGNSKIAPSKLFLSYIDSDNTTYIRVSNDLGKTWGKPAKISKKESSALSLTVCGDEKEQAAFVLYSNKDKLKLKMFKIEEDGDEDVDSLKSPFKGMKMAGGIIKCHKNGRRYELQVLATDYDETVAYLSTMSLKD
jgi:hypothetical protein